VSGGAADAADRRQMEDAQQHLEALGSAKARVFSLSTRTSRPSRCRAAPVHRPLAQRADPGEGAQAGDPLRGRTFRTRRRPLTPARCPGPWLQAGLRIRARRALGRRRHHARTNALVEREGQGRDEWGLVPICASAMTLEVRQAGGIGGTKRHNWDPGRWPVCPQQRSPGGDRPTSRYGRSAPARGRQPGDAQGGRGGHPWRGFRGSRRRAAANCCVSVWRVGSAGTHSVTMAQTSHRWCPGRWGQLDASNIARIAGTGNGRRCMRHGTGRTDRQGHSPPPIAVSVIRAADDPVVLPAKGKGGGLSEPVRRAGSPSR